MMRIECAANMVNTFRFLAYCYLPSFCLSRASPDLHFFPSLLFSGSFVQCAQLFHQFLTFPIPGTSIFQYLQYWYRWMHSIIPTTHNSDIPLLRQPITPTAHYSFVQCAQLFHQFLTFPIPGRSIIIALNGDVQPRIKAPFPFQNILFIESSIKK
jgi:hypothetical protein